MGGAKGSSEPNEPHRSATKFTGLCGPSRCIFDLDKMFLALKCKSLLIAPHNYRDGLMRTQHGLTLTGRVSFLLHKVVLVAVMAYT